MKSAYSRNRCMMVQTNACHREREEMNVLLNAKWIRAIVWRQLNLQFLMCGLLRIYRKFIRILLMEFMFIYSKFKCYRMLRSVVWYTVTDVMRNCCSFIIRRLRSMCITLNAYNSEPNQSIAQLIWKGPTGRSISYSHLTSETALYFSPKDSEGSSKKWVMWGSHSGLLKMQDFWDIALEILDR